MGLPYLDRLVLGCWQLASGHGTRVDDAATVLAGYYGAGFRVFDAADIYTGVEAALGDVAAAHGLHDLRVHTKYVPDLAALPTLGPDDVARAIDRSCARLRRDVLDLVQFHWWDLALPGWIDALHALHDLQRQGRVRAIGLTNFDTAHLRTILDAGVPIASLQVQYSVLDRRPRGALAGLALAHGVDLLAYGSVAGGLLSDAYLGAGPLGGDVENRSLVKYALVVEEIGGWGALQAALRELRAVADERGSDVASVASAWCLREPGVRACIVGIRSLRHLERHRRLLDDPPLRDDEVARLEAARSRYPEVPGDVYALERDRDGRHGRVMKYGLARGAA